jgi:hypothetical protein
VPASPAPALPLTGGSARARGAAVAPAPGREAALALPAQRVEVPAGPAVPVTAARSVPPAPPAAAPVRRMPAELPLVSVAGETLPVAGSAPAAGRAARLPVPNGAPAARPVAQAPPAVAPPPAPLPLVIARLPESPEAVAHAAPAPGPDAVELPAQLAQEHEGSVAPAAAGVAAVPGGHSDRELDALAHQLYDRLRSRLRMELLVDRERAGLITDMR